MTTQKISLFVDNQIPDYVQEYYPLFVIFVTKYFEWLDQQGNPQNVIQSLMDERDIDTASETAAYKFLRQYAPGFPKNFAANRNVLVKYFRDFYERKGSENSFKFFFKAFFDDNITIARPRETLFTTSESHWSAERILKVSNLVGNPEDLEHTYVYGSSSTARAKVNQVVKTNRNTWSIYLQRDSIEGTFSSSEAIVGYLWDFAADSSSQVVVVNTEPMSTQGGRFLDSRSQLSSDRVLQDNYFFQNFSYVIQTHVNRELWYNSILRQLHPSGHMFFTNHRFDATLQPSDATFSRGNDINTQVALYNEKSFILAPGYTFDRLADFKTGTSATTTAGAISYTASYSFQGENVTWASQRGGDEVVYGETRTQFVGTGATFDKVGAGVGLDQQIVADGWGVTSSNVTEIFHSETDLALSSNARIASGSLYGMTSALIIITWMKDPSGNTSSEATNAIHMSFSSTAGMAITYDTQVQKMYQRFAGGRTLFYPKLTYYSTSDTLTCTTGYSSGDTTTSPIRFTFKPYNANRSQSYSRAILRFSNIGGGGIIDYGFSVSSTATFNALSADHLNISVVGI